jgi:hypothetical protein
MKSSIFLLPAAFLMLSGAAFAADQAATTAQEKPAKTASVKKPTKTASVQSEKSKKCSAEANEKKLHGKARKAFRKECMKKAG